MADTFTDGFCLKLIGLLDDKQIKIVRDLLYCYTLNYDIKPISTELSVKNYQLPDAYYIFMATKEQDGKLHNDSCKQYKLCLENLLFRLQLPLNNITTNHLRLYLSEISINPKTGKHLSTATLNQRKAIIRSFFKWLYEEEYIIKDPSSRIKDDKVTSKPRTAYSDTQIETLKLHCDSLRIKAIIDVLASSGIRIAELSKLNRTDINFDTGEITVFGKGNKWRTCYIDASAIVSLQAYLNSRTDNKDAVFVSERAPYDRLSTGAIRKILHKLSDKSGVDNVFPHRFRHTLATHAIDKGMPIESIQALLGHSGINTTLRYTHLSNDKIKNDYKKYLG